MQDKTPEPTADAVNRTASETSSKKPHAAKEDGLCNPRDGRGPLRKCDDQHAKLPVH